MGKNNSEKYLDNEVLNKWKEKRIKYLYKQFEYRETIYDADTEKFMSKDDFIKKLVAMEGLQKYQEGFCAFHQRLIENLIESSTLDEQSF